MKYILMGIGVGFGFAVTLFILLGFEEFLKHLKWMCQQKKDA